MSCLKRVLLPQWSGWDRHKEAPPLYVGRRHVDSFRPTMKYVLGIDESGTGAWAGPFVIAGVLLEKGYGVPGVTDSKKLRDRKRRYFAPLIEKEAVAHYCHVVEVEDIRRMTHRGAWRHAVVMTALTLLEHAHLDQTQIVIDGNVDAGVHTRIHECYKSISITFMPKADVKVQAVSAASILAKTKRNDLMIALGERYPEYGFAANAGYGTSDHAEALVNYGRSVHHRPLQVKWEVPERRET